MTRPEAGPVPDLTAPIDVLRELLKVERERLVVAREIERKREIVFPETSVIVRDIERLLLEVEKREQSAVAKAAAEAKRAALRARHGSA